MFAHTRDFILISSDSHYTYTQKPLQEQGRCTFTHAQARTRLDFYYQTVQITTHQLVLDLKSCQSSH